MYNKRINFSIPWNKKITKTNKQKNKITTNSSKPTPNKRLWIFIDVFQRNTIKKQKQKQLLHTHDIQYCSNINNSDINNSYMRR